jgi:hypothetical protein
MKNRKGDEWIPLWVDKWLFGSTRHELLPDEQSVWVDFMVLGAKDEGYIRANPFTPYPISQLAGLLCKSEELIQRTIDKCLKTINPNDKPKLTLTEHKTLYITNYEEYQLSKRQMFRLKAQNTAIVAQKVPPSMLVSPNLNDSSNLNKGVVKGEEDEKDQIALHLAKLHNQYCPAQEIALSRKHFLSALNTGLKIKEQDIENNKGMLCWNIIKLLEGGKNGSKSDRESRKKTCLKCKGSGEVNNRIDRDYKETCLNCKGTGRVWND